jgi:hypothetical protein
VSTSGDHLDYIAANRYIIETRWQLVITDVALWLASAISGPKLPLFSAAPTSRAPFTDKGTGVRAAADDLPDREAAHVTAIERLAVLIVALLSALD